MGRIIALQGIKESGKSTTIGLLYDKMLKSGYTVIKKRKRGSYDFVAIVEKNGVKIGIITYGDAPSLIKDKINICIEYGCTIIICACHPNGKTATVLLTFKDFQPVQYVTKTISNDEKSFEGINKQDAQGLFDRIERIIGR